VPNPPDFSSAEYVLASKGKSFHWARRLLKKHQAERATRLYRLCRYIDDLGDEESSVEASRQKLLEARNAVDSDHADHEVLIDGLRLLNECDIDKKIILDLIAGVSSDTQLVRIENQAQLLRYCYQVAGTVGLMMTKVLDTQDKAAYPFAIDLGIAMQLTNICRDIKADALVNRRYIPAELIKDLEPISLIYPNEQQKDFVIAAVANLLAIAEKYYQSGEKGLSYLPLQARLSILVAARVYREIGRELLKQNCEYWHHRITISTSRKMLITARSLISVLFNFSFWRHPKKHDTDLHRDFNNTVASELISFKSYAS
jgi:phytoene synthase